MKQTAKILLIIAVALIAIGGIIFVSAMAKANWDFTRLSVSRYTRRSHIITDKFRNISITVDTADVAIFPTDSAEVLVECHELEQVQHAVSVKDGTLVIEVNDTRAWYEHIGIFWGNSKVAIHLPQEKYESLVISSDTGDISLSKNYAFQNITLSSHTGGISCSASVENIASIKATTGDIRVESITAGSLELSVSTGNITGNNITCQGNIKINVSTGNTNLTDLQCCSLISTGSTGDMLLQNVVATETFSIERSTGDVKFVSCDAGEINVATGTGDVTGNFVTDKIFLTETDTGRIDVPKSTAGGKCEIQTDTGDIMITIG